MYKNGFAPQIYTESIIDLNYFLISPVLSIGGFSDNLNFGTKLTFGKSNNFCIKSYNLESLLQQRESNNVSIYLQLKLSFVNVLDNIFNKKQSNSFNCWTMCCRK